jgi:hypothetical protein
VVVVGIAGGSQQLSNMSAVELGEVDGEKSGDPLPPLQILPSSWANKASRTSGKTLCEKCFSVNIFAIK